MQPSKVITIATRTSNLALAQTNIVKQLLLTHFPWLQINIIGIKTTGDKILTSDLTKIGGKGLFVKELEDQLLNGKADLAVHSMKDMPAQQPNGLTVAAILPRANPCDVIVSKAGYSLTSLPKHATVGSSSLRRQAQLLAKRPDLQLKLLRGNVDTRIKKLYADEYDAIILAQAGLDRLQINHVPQYKLSLEEMLPAVAQGAIGIECRHDNLELLDLLAVLSDPPTTLCVLSERKMNATLNGSCSTPIAGHAEIIVEKSSANNRTMLKLTGMVAHTDGSKQLFASAKAKLSSLKNSTGNIEQAILLGKTVARALIDQGAQDILCNQEFL